MKKMSRFLRQWPLSLHHKTAKLQNMAPILPILQLFMYLFYSFCVVKFKLYIFLLRKIHKICHNDPKTAALKLKVPWKRQISTFYLNSFCADSILPNLIKFVKNDFVYFVFESFSILAFVSTKTKNASTNINTFFEFLSEVKYFFCYFLPY